MKLRIVIVVAPMRSKIAPKSGRDNPRSNKRVITTVLKIMRLGPNSKIKVSKNVHPILNYSMGCLDVLQTTVMEG